MKVTCCCFTCLICEDGKEDDEKSRLISNKEGHDALPETEPPGTSQPSVGKNEGEVHPVVNENPSVSQQENSHSISRSSRARRYYMMSKKYSVDEITATEETAVWLRIAFNIINPSGVVKIFALEARNVFDVLSKLASVESSGLDDKAIVQLRTKVLPSEVRGHSNKYEVAEGLGGSLRFHKERLHDIPASEFTSSFVRFRLYHVFKHQRDVLLGEYVIDCSALNLDLKTSSTTDVELVMHDPAATNARPPEVLETRAFLSSVSSSSQEWVEAPAVFKKTIRRGDTRAAKHLPIPSFQSPDEREERKGSSEDGSTTDEGGIKSRKVKRAVLTSVSRQSSDKVSSEDVTSSGTAQTKKEKVDKKTALEWLRKGGQERSEKVSKLQDATSELAQSASDLNSTSMKLREKYEKKYRRRISLD